MKSFEAALWRLRNERKLVYFEIVNDGVHYCQFFIADRRAILQLALHLQLAVVEGF